MSEIKINNIYNTCQIEFIDMSKESEKIDTKLKNKDFEIKRLNETNDQSINKIFDLRQKCSDLNLLYNEYLQLAVRN